MGPLVSKRQRELVRRPSKQALKDGAKLEVRRQLRRQGRLLLPAHGADRTAGRRPNIMQQEIFGPVLPIATFKTLDEAIAYANDCEYGLTSSIYTRSLDVAMRASNELKFGETYVNRENFEAMQGFHAGWRKSGIGGADGKHGLEEYLQTHVVYMNYDLNKQ
jgi:lactaldehyde dehydrogenase/glycolaldehyde dehydrogenase